MSTKKAEEEPVLEFMDGSDDSGVEIEHREDDDARRGYDSSSSESSEGLNEEGLAEAVLASEARLVDAVAQKRKLGPEVRALEDELEALGVAAESTEAKEKRAQLLSRYTTHLAGPIVVL
jgi:hypothetical protein